jgi:hypothetical protein
MNLFKPFTLKWWQGSLFKISMITGGVAIGAYWYQFFMPLIVPFVVIAVLTGIYVSCVWWKQINGKKDY